MGRRKNDELRPCFRCGIYCRPERHHLLHGSGRRHLAEEDGLVVDMCHQCHMYIHDHPAEDKRFQAYGQKAWMENTGGTVADFIQRYGKSYV